MAVTFYMHDNKVVGFQNKTCAAMSVPTAGQREGG
jgi:hypothetical protein